MDMDVIISSASAKHDARTRSHRKFGFSTFVSDYFSARLAKSAGNPLGSPVAASVIAALFLLLTSCATLTEEQRADREYESANKLVLAREDFERKAAACVRRGGAMQITRYSSSPRIQKLTVHEYKTAQCLRF